LKPGDDIKLSLLNFVKHNKLYAANIVSCVGSLQAVQIRLASDNTGSMSFFNSAVDDKFEIVSLVGTIEANENDSYGHLHISFADKNGKVFGGHLMSGCFVYTTAEITIVDLESFRYTREFDITTGFKELNINNNFFK
jgi:predicted DNA-binding protein with PD1-like motif